MASNTGDAAAAPAHIYETQDELVLMMDLPGHDPSTVSIKVEGDVLTVHASRPEPQFGKGRWLRQERSLGQVARTFMLSALDGSRCEASYHHGLLTLASFFPSTWAIPAACLAAICAALHTLQIHPESIDGWSPYYTPAQWLCVSSPR